ncbi:hypothetical protein [Erythrobacter donghaensis]|uniref:hypothetical protein n=2 Tax=Erythrobacter donghaensis TaxID=267135 RepID=UPI00093E4068|nr:hypothetical protein [Erythrobacter donghaensis]
MRLMRLFLSAILCLSVLAPLSAPVSAGNAAVYLAVSEAPQDPACPDDCCDDCPDFTDCRMGCAMAVLPDRVAEALPRRFTPDPTEAIAPHHSAKLPPATPPPRTAART